MNLTQLTSLTAALAGDAQQSRYSGKYTEALNLAQQQFCLDSKALWKDAAITIVDGTASYALPADFMWEKRVTLKQVPLTPVSREVYDSERGSDWTTETGRPNRYIVDPEEGRKTITLTPTPTADIVGDSCVMTYYPLPADMAAGTDSPLNASALMGQFHIGIAHWAAWLLLGYETEQSGSIVAKRGQLLSVYNDTVTLATDTFKNTASAPLEQEGSRGQRRGL